MERTGASPGRARIERIRLSVLASSPAAAISSVALATSSVSLTGLAGSPLHCSRVSANRSPLDSVTTTPLDALAARLAALGDFALARADRIVEIEINPLFVYETGVTAVDALIHVAK